MANLRTNNLSGEQGQNAYRGSVFFDGSTGYLDIASNSDFAYGTGDFTWEAWVLLARGQATGYIFDHGSDGGTLQYESNNVRYYNSTTGNSGALYDDGGSIDYDGWYHIAVARSSGTTKLFVNGIQKASASDSHNYSAQALTIGDYGANTGTNKWRGYISNARITKGEAVYTANFTPSTSELTADANTVLLCCQDSNDPTQEETGKTITASGSLATAGYLETQPKVIPPYGVDAGNTFGGPIQQSSQGYMYFPTGRTEERGRGRAVLFQGLSDSSGGYTNNIDFIEIQTLGNSMRFGDLGNFVGLGAGISNSTRGIFAGGSRPTQSPFSGGNQNFLEFVTIATTGNGQDFGGVSTLFRYGAGISNSTRGLICGAYQGGGASGTLNTIQYLTIATLGDTLDFGDMTNNSGSGVQGMGATSSPTRGITFGGGTPTTINEINSITIGTLGNSVDFGDLSSNRYLCQGVSNGTRGVVAGGDNSGAVNIIEFITIASTGDAQDFGDLSSISEFAGGTGGSNKIRGVFVGRGDWTDVDNAISYITIATTGNASDFGDIRTGLQNYGTNALPDSHGGLS